MLVVKYRKIFYALSTLLIAGSIFAISFWGLKLGTDFSGGSSLEVSFIGEMPAIEKVVNSVTAAGFPNASVRKAGTDSYIIKLEEISQAKKDEILNAIKAGGAYTPAEKSFNSVGPVLGKEAVNKSWISIVLVLLAIVLFVAFAFRKVSRPVSSWVYGGVAILALLHDVIIPTGVFALLGHLYGFEVDTLFVTALLVILGFSVHDTIVVFDRVRENLHRDEKSDFPTIVGRSINETFLRSVNTSLTTLLAIVILYIFGPESVRHFSLVLLIGITVGTYSSIFFGSPLLVTINNWRSKK